MQFLQDFHSQYSKVQPGDHGQFLWRIEPGVFETLASMAKKQGTNIEADSLILFLPYEIGSTSTGTVELIGRPSL